MDWRLSFRPGFHFIAVLAVVGAFGSLLVVLVSPRAQAQTSWTATTDSWFKPGSWTAGVPTNGANAFIDNGGTSQVLLSGAKTQDLFVGNTNPGTLEIANGGTLTSANSPFPKGSVVGAASGSHGEVMISGSGSRWTNTGLLTIGNMGVGELAVTGGGNLSDDSSEVGAEDDSTGEVTVNGGGSTWTNTGFLDLGRSGSGTLTVSDGGSVSCLFVGIAGFSGSGHGSVTVTGQGSTFTSSNWVEVGDRGTGTLAISDGAQVNATEDTFVGQTFGEGSISFDHGTLTTRALWAAADKLSGTGTVNTHGLVTDVDLVFDQSHGIQQQVLLASQPGQAITINLNVDGTGSLGVGYGGQGSLLITGGRAVSSTGSYLGYHSGAAGTATVTGHNSAWNTSSLTVGYQGEGRLTVADGGQVSTGSSSIGGTTGLVTVKGLNSKLTIGAGNGLEPAFTVGGLNGQLTVVDGGVVSSTTSAVGLGSGMATITGVGSRWNDASDVFIGGSWFGASGTGRVFISNGGMMTVGGTMTVWQPGQISIGPGGTVKINKNLINDGKIDVAGDGTLSAIAITNSGALTGSGKITTTSTFTNAGTVAPGSSPGTLSIAGEYVQQSAGGLIIQVGGTGAGQFDVLDVTGSATLAGTLDVPLIDLGAGMFIPKLGDVFTILNASGGVTGRFDTLLSSLPGHLEWDIVYDSNSVSLIVVPEPTGLLLVVLAVFWWPILPSPRFRSYSPALIRHCRPKMSNGRSKVGLSALSAAIGDSNNDWKTIVSKPMS